MAVLVFLTGAARAWRVAADIQISELAGLRVTDRRARERGGDAAQLASIDVTAIIFAREGVDVRGDEVGKHGQVELGQRFFHPELDARDRAGHILTDVAEHALEQGKGFLLIFADRRLLRIGAQVNDLTERVEGRRAQLATLA